MGRRGIRCIFIGCASNSKAYKFLNLKSNVILQSKDVEFSETLTTLGKNSQVPTIEDSREEKSSKVVEKRQVFRKSKRVCKVMIWDPIR